MKEQARIMLEALRKTESKFVRKTAIDILENRHSWFVTKETPEELANRGFFGEFMLAVMRGKYKEAYQLADTKSQAVLRPVIPLELRR